jgi:hypothetical protein
MAMLIARGLFPLVRAVLPVKGLWVDKESIVGVYTKPVAKNAIDPIPE